MRYLQLYEEFTPNNPELKVEPQQVTLHTAHEYVEKKEGQKEEEQQDQGNSEEPNSDCPNNNTPMPNE